MRGTYCHVLPVADRVRSYKGMPRSGRGQGPLLQGYSSCSWAYAASSASIASSGLHLAAFS